MLHVMLPIVNLSYFPTVVLSSAGNRWRHECGLSAGTRWRYECVAAMTDFLVESGAAWAASIVSFFVSSLSWLLVDGSVE